MNKKLLSLILVSVIVFSGFAAAGAASTTKASAALISTKATSAGAKTIVSKTHTSLTLRWSPLYPKRAQTYTVFGYLTPAIPPVMAKAPISIHRVASNAPVMPAVVPYWKTVYTDAYGRYTFTDKESTHKHVFYKVYYLGNARYYSSMVDNRVNIGQTTTEAYPFGAVIWGPSDKLGFIHWVKIRVDGDLYNAYGHGIANAPVKLYARVRVVNEQTGAVYRTAWQYFETAYTNSHGSAVSKYHLVYLPHAGGVGAWSWSFEQKATFVGYPYSSSQYWWSEGVFVPLP